MTLAQQEYLVVTNNLHGMFSSLTVKQNICCALVTDNIHFTIHFQAGPRNKKYISLKHLVTAVTTIFLESCFQA